MTFICGVDCPEDVIILIIEECLDLFDEDEPRRRCDRLLTLTHVCRDWRNVALSVSSLWSNIAYYDDPHTIGEWLQRSRNAPLTLHFNDLPNPRVTSYVSESELLHHIERVTELALPNTKALQEIARHGSQARQLQKLYLKACHRGPASRLDSLCPLLTHLTIRADDTYYKSWSLPPSLRYLTVHSQDGMTDLPDNIMPTVSHVLSMLEQVPHLKSWTWDIGHPIDISESLPRIVRLAELRSLSLIGFAPEELQLLAALSLPVLDDMELVLTLENSPVDEVQSQLDDIFDTISPHLATLDSAEPKFSNLEITIILNWEEGMDVMFELNRPRTLNEAGKGGCECPPGVPSENSWLQLKFEQITMPDPDWERFDTYNGPVDAPWLDLLPRLLFDALPSLSHSLRALHIELDCEYFVRHHQFPYLPVDVFTRLHGLETIHFATTCSEERLDLTTTGTHEAFAAMLTWVPPDRSYPCAFPKLSELIYTKHQFTTRDIRKIARALKLRRSCDMPRITISFDDCVLDNLSEDVRRKMLNLLYKYAIVENPDELQAWCTTSTDGSSDSGGE